MNGFFVHFRFTLFPISQIDFGKSCVGVYRVIDLARRRKEGKKKEKLLKFNHSQ